MPIALPDGDVYCVDVSSPLHIITSAVRCALLMCVLVGSATAQSRAERVAPTPAPRTANFDLLNPVALLSQAIATLIGTEAQHVMLGDGSRYAASLVARSAALVNQSEMRVAFATGNERSKVSLLLAESQVRVRLAEDLQLRCEISSRDEANADPELALDVGVRFKFK